MAKLKILDGIYVVHWRDANARGGWDSRSEYLKHDVAEVVTVGFLLKKDEKSITLVATQCKDWADCNGAISIPVEWCQSIKRLTRLDVGRKRPTRKTRKAGLDNSAKIVRNSPRRRKKSKNARN